MRTLTLTIILGIACSLTSYCQAQQIITHMGYVSDLNQNPLPDGTYNITFKLYESQTGGTAVWTETDVVKTKSGYFSSYLGDQASFPGSIHFDSPMWLGIAPDGANELSPRVKLTTVPYSFHSIHSDTAVYAINGSDWQKAASSIYHDGKVGIGTSDPEYELHIKQGNGDAQLELERFGNNPGYFTIGGNGDGFVVGHFSSSGSYRKDMVVAHGAKVGIGLNDPEFSLHIRKSNGDAQIKLEWIGNNPGYPTIGGNGDGFVVGHFKNNGSYSRDMIVKHGGRVEVSCIEITGGYNIKEDLNSVSSLEPGDIVVIDPSNPGQITTTTNPYHKKVAGVISGANGVNPGLSLSQNDVLESEYPLTMVGRTLTFDL